MASYFYLVMLLSPLAASAQQFNSQQAADLLTSAFGTFLGQGGGDVVERLGEVVHQVAGESTDESLRLIKEYTHNPVFKDFLETNINAFKDYADQGLEYVERMNSPDFPIELVLAKTYATAMARSMLRNLDAEFVLRNVDSLASSFLTRQQ